MKVAIITSRYPSKNNPYNHMFVHMRSIEMIKQGIDVTIFIPSNKNTDYEHENVNVKMMSSSDIINNIKSFDILYLHLLNIYPFKNYNGWIIYKYILKTSKPFVMYVHGSEVQKYRARLFDFNFKIFDFLKWFKKDILVIPKMKQFVNKTKSLKNGAYLFPSNWMKDEMELNLNTKINNFKIIPNGIDTDLFKFHKSFEKRYKLLTLRPLSSKKYAVDIAINVIKFLPESFTLEIYGKGKYQNLYQNQINSLGLSNRIVIKNEFIDRSILNTFFSQFGVFLSPTRMDAQGVSMCEAMASGLLTVSNDNTAIPEFIENNSNGILAETPQEIAKKIIEVTNSENLFKKITNSGRISIENIDIKQTVNNEISFLKNILKNKM